ncbi:MAG: 50S ribosomal protein L10 [Syntrophales bacterium]|nr:50S ribosomal protein L10 [Syntrophales bacterium]MDD5640929.1 50S ribosomal protein L10 [Syntrophales bacterium]
MRKSMKAEIVQDLQERIGRSQFNILADFTGLQVEEMTRLRQQVREVDGELRVVKNTLLTRAATGDSPLAPLSSHFVGPNAVTFGYGDPVSLAKVLVKFAQEKPKFKLKAGVLSGQVLTAQEVDALSKLPDREILLAQFLGVLQGVPTALVTVLAGVIRNLLNVLVALKDKKAEAEPAEAAPAAEPEAATPAAEAAPQESAPAAEAEPEAAAPEASPGPEKEPAGE